MGATKGSGSIFRQPGRKNWMVQVYHGGRAKAISSGTSDKRKARAFLNEKLGELDSGKTTLADLHGARGALRLEEAAAILDRRHKNEQRKNRIVVQKKIANHLIPYFGKDRRLDDITATEIEQYTSDRLDTGIKLATVCEELTALRRMYRIAIEQGRLSRRPTIVIPEPNNARRGWFEPEQFAAVSRHLPEHMRGPVAFAYYTGWRFAAEVCKLEWWQVDPVAQIVRIDNTKNGGSREFPYGIVPELVALMTRQAAIRDAFAKRGTIVARVFVDDDGDPLVHDAMHRLGGVQLYWQHRAAWRQACKAAGAVGRILHDMRRTAVRNLVRAGVPESVCMEITGHRSRRVFKRYDIVNDRDIRAGVARLAQFMQAAASQSA